MEYYDATAHGNLVDFQVAFIFLPFAIRIYLDSLFFFSPITGIFRSVILVACVNTYVPHYRYSMRWTYRLAPLHGQFGFRFLHLLRSIPNRHTLRWDKLLKDTLHRNGYFWKIEVPYYYQIWNYLHHFINIEINENVLYIPTMFTSSRYQP